MQKTVFEVKFRKLDVIFVDNKDGRKNILETIKSKYTSFLKDLLLQDTNPFKANNHRPLDSINEINSEVRSVDKELTNYILPRILVTP